MPIVPLTSAHRSSSSLCVRLWCLNWWQRIFHCCTVSSQTCSQGYVTPVQRWMHCGQRSPRSATNCILSQGRLALSGWRRCVCGVSSVGVSGVVWCISAVLPGACACVCVCVCVCYLQPGSQYYAGVKLGSNRAFLTLMMLPKLQRLIVKPASYCEASVLLWSQRTFLWLLYNYNVVWWYLTVFLSSTCVCVCVCVGPTTLPDHSATSRAHDGRTQWQWQVHSLEGTYVPSWSTTSSS